MGTSAVRWESQSQESCTLVRLVGHMGCMAARVWAATASLDGHLCVLASSPPLDGADARGVTGRRKKEEERGQEAGLMMILAMRPNARRARAISLVPLGRAAPSSAWQIRCHLGTAHQAHSFSFKPEPACTPPLRHILAGKAGNLQVGERSP